MTPAPRLPDHICENWACLRGNIHPSGGGNVIYYIKVGYVVCPMHLNHIVHAHGGEMVPPVAVPYPQKPQSTISFIKEFLLTPPKIFVRRQMHPTTGQIHPHS